jgi:hypothetical protein
MVERAQLSAAQLLALIAANLAPIERCSDGQWRTGTRQFPSEGVAEDDVVALWRLRLVERTPTGAIITDLGRTVLLSRENADDASTATPAQSGTQDATLSVH